MHPETLTLNGREYPFSPLLDSHIAAPVEDPDPPGHVLCASPPIILLPDLIPPADAESITAASRPRLTASTIVADDHLAVSPGRSSTNVRMTAHGSSACPQCPALASLVERLVALSGRDVRHAEAAQVVHYRDREHYEPHADYFTAAHPRFLEPAGERLMTFLVYLSTVPPGHGGGTFFPHLGILVQPRQGSVLYWNNTDAQARGIPETQHAGLALSDAGVQAGTEKWVLNLWIHERPFAQRSSPLR